MASQVLMLTAMAEKIVVMAGPSRFDNRTLQFVAREFGWSVESVDDLRDIVTAHRHSGTTAVLFHRDAFGTCSWLHAVRLVKAALPKVHAIACHGFSEPIDWPELCAAGAFHSLGLPLKENEVRQSLGFVWGARKRSVPARKPYANQRIIPGVAHRFDTRALVSVIV